MSEEKKPFEGWCILELLGHRRLGGYVREEPLFGASMCRIDVPGPDGATVATQFYGGGSVYCLTPTTEAVARAVGARAQPAPATPWELRPALPAPAAVGVACPDCGQPNDDCVCESEEEDDDF